MAQDKKSSWSLLGRLRTAVKKVTFLINSNVIRWRIVSSLIGRGGGGGRHSHRRLSFNERFGLTAIVSSSDEENDNNWPESFDSGSSGKSPGGGLQKTKSFPLQRTVSFPEEEDINKRAEMFIENFYRQLKMERQVSLQLRYKRDASFGSSDSPSP